MPEPQRTDGGSAEGKDSVISVSLELITEEYASRRFKTSESVHSKSKKPLPQGNGAITHLFPPSKPLRILMVLDPSMGPGHIGEILDHGPFFGPRGPPIALMACRPRRTAQGLQTTAYGPPPTDHRTPKHQNGQ
ncbi:hypothetical protein O181_124400 [Austropuccinia psidii MF-1]|uniref:Uncharacterized protein n=1 Tax=Austropuccinia psidii MF-1 TaxID=1389203 RepID=A0A9Q3KMY0_9BASI|nr:hypothetical protein [Austropuccinia psidii MF-1]